MNAVLVGVVASVRGKLTVFLLEDHLSEKKTGLGKYEVGLDSACMATAGTTASGLAKRTLLGVSDFFSDQVFLF